MSTLKVTHLQNESNSAPSISISSAVGGGVTFAGISTFHDNVHIDSNFGVGTNNPGSPLEVNGGSGLDVATFNSHHADGPLINVQRSGTAIGFVGSGKNLHSTTGSVDALALRSQAEFTIATGGATERLRMTAAGKLLVNTTTSRSVSDNSGNGPTPPLQIEAANSGAIMSIIAASTADAHRSGTINLGRHRNTVGETPSLVNNGDTLGSICFSGGDGSDMLSVAAHIRGLVDGAPGNNDMPGALSFSTTPDGSSSPYLQERLRITSAGDVNIGPSANANGHGLLTLSQSAAAAFNALVIQQGNTLFTATDGLQIGIDAGVHAYIKQYENRDIYFTTGNPNSEKLRITSAGQVQATGPGSSGSVISSKVTTNNGGYLAYEGIASNNTTTFSVNHNGTIYTAGGIQFETANTGTNISSQTLDDYEEGTWTPTMNKSGTTGSITTYHNSDSRLGYYRKVGSLLYISFYMYATSQTFGTGVGQWYVSGLPFSLLTLIPSAYQSIPGGYMAINGNNYNFASGTGNGLASGVRWQSNSTNGAATLAMYGVQHNTNWTSGSLEVSGFGCLMTT